MEAFPDHDPHKTHAFRSNISRSSGAQRVSTDPQSSSSSSRKAHLHGLHHHHHRHHHHRQSRHGQDGSQSALQLHPPTSFGDLLKQASRSKNTSPTRSNSKQESVPEDDQNTRGVRAPPPKLVRPEDVTRERVKVRAREEALRSSLQVLSDQSLKTSRQLDDTYYSILEKVTVLRQTIGSLQELSSLTKDLHDSFLSDTKELTDETKGQIAGFNNFEVQEGQLNVLEERIKRGKEKADALTTRLAEARKRVEARVKGEAEWEAWTNRRLRALWGILGTIAGLMLVAMLFNRLKPRYVPKDTSHDLTFGSRSLLNAPIPEDTKEAIVSPFSSRLAQSVSTPSPLSDTREDSRLRIFDEL